MKKKILIMGADSSGKQALLKAIKSASPTNMVVFVMPPAHGPSEKMICIDSGCGSIGGLSAQDIANHKLNELCKALEDMAASSEQAKDDVFEFVKCGDLVEFHKPKRIHPKHQKNNKYRFKK